LFPLLSLGKNSNPCKLLQGMKKTRKKI